MLRAPFLARAFDRVRGSLSVRLALLLALVGIAGAAAVTLLLQTIITPSFARLELAVAAAHRERSEAALHEIADRARAIAERRAGDIVARRRIIGEAPPEILPLATRADFATALKGRASAQFFARDGKALIAFGLARLPGAPARAVAVTRRADPAALAAITGLSARVAPLGTGYEPIARDGALDVPIQLQGADGRPTLDVIVRTPRALSRLGVRMLIVAASGVVALLAVMLGVLLSATTQLMLRPLGEVERHMREVERSGSLAALPTGGRRDEIGSLIGTFNAMLRRLSDLQRQVEQQGFAQGRSDHEAAVRHNLRNALNPIATLLSIGADRPEPIDPALLGRAIDELGREDIDPERRRQLATFARMAIDAAEADRRDVRQGMRAGRDSLRSALEIVGRPSEPPTAAGPDSCDLAEILGRSSAVAQFAGESPIAFLPPVAPCRVVANRVVLTQVIANLLANAAEAIRARSDSAGTIRATIVETDDIAMLTIADDGEGFSEIVGKQLFQRGYSTRTDKAGGLGLHWCANAVSQMGGTLRLESDGPGQGARAILRLPRADADARKAA